VNDEVLRIKLQNDMS